MATRIEKKFEDLRAKGKKAFIPYITAGDPSLEGTYDLVLSLEAAGADLIEIGVPFLGSDRRWARHPTGHGKGPGQRRLAGKNPHTRPKSS